MTRSGLGNIAKGLASSNAEFNVNEHAVVVGLNAAIVRVHEGHPQVLVVRHTEQGDSPDEIQDGLPFGPFEPLQHRTLEIGLRSWVEEQTSLPLGYVEQLYTFGDRGRHTVLEGEHRVISVGYLALTGQVAIHPTADALWQDWYRFFPWEDWRDRMPPMINMTIRPALEHWAAAGESPQVQRSRLDRVRICFGFEGIAWDEEKVLERYELLYEAGLVYEAVRDRELDVTAELPEIGHPMYLDHRRILSTAMGRLRGKLKYRPVIFELMPPTFTLLELQRTVEAISGIELHKQNFRRLVERSGLVESTGQVSTRTGGRPAQQFRFRREVLRERPAPGMRVPSLKTRP